MGRNIPRKKSRSGQSPVLGRPRTSSEHFPVFPKKATISSLPGLFPIALRNAGNASWNFLTSVSHFKQNYKLMIMEQWILFNHVHGWPPKKTWLSFKITNLFRQIDKMTFEEAQLIWSYLKPSTMTIQNKKAKVEPRPYFKFSLLPSGYSSKMKFRKWSNFVSIFMCEDNLSFE